ncbi:MAG: tyrosine-type recombinase/integrase [Candidatus Methanomethylicaceae archaeon]|jgi:integrase/recombinase XerD
MRSKKDPVNWEDPVVKRWIGGITRASTQSYYKSAFRIYISFTGKTPSKLIDEALKDSKREPRKKQDVVMRSLVDFYNWLKTEYNVRSRGKGEHVVVGKGVSDKVAGTYANVVRSFYDTFGISVKMKGRHALPRGRVTNKRIRINAEQVRQLADHTRTPRDKAIILTLFQSGMDVSTLCSLKYGDIAAGLKADDLPLRLDLYRPKTCVEYFTFLGKDAVEAIKTYLKDCESRGIKLTKDTALFLTERGREPIETHNVQNMLRDAAIKAGFISKEESGNPRFFNPYGPHALRESFGSLMINSGVPDTIVDFWLGHSIGQMAEAYKGIQAESVKKMFTEREHLLSPFAAMSNGELQKKVDVIVSEKSKTLNEGMATLALKNADLENRLTAMIAENASLKSQFEDVRQEVSELTINFKEIQRLVAAKIKEVSNEDNEMLKKS